MCLNACRCGCLLAVASLPAACLPAACCLRPSANQHPHAKPRAATQQARAGSHCPHLPDQLRGQRAAAAGRAKPQDEQRDGAAQGGPVVLLRLCRRCVAERVEGRDRGQAGQRARFCADGRRQGAQSAEGRASTPTAASAPGCPRQRPGVHAPPRCAACPSPSGPRAQRRCLHQRHAPGRPHRSRVAAAWRCWKGGAAWVREGRAAEK